MLERVLPHSSAHFALSLASSCPGVPAGTKCFSLADSADGTRVTVTGTTASELSAGVGVYLREYCGMTVGWERGGGSNVFTPSPWPRIGARADTRPRSVPYSHVTQVCTHSYTLVWHDWARWQAFIDWMALAGHNSIVAPTGQEEVQYRVLTEQFGLSDMAVRNWTNGPAWLTWSRGQNSHGNGIGGPLPRSFMRGQWRLQKQILARYRELGIAGHLPAFGGYVPWSLAVVQNATRRIARGTGAATDTAWIDGRDPLFTAVADAWMEAVIADFGSDHVWQMDGFFGNGTGWGATGTPRPEAGVDQVPCLWSAAIDNTYLSGYLPGGYVGLPTLAEAKAACLNDTYVRDCGGVVSRSGGAGPFELRAGTKPLPVPPSDREASYVVTNKDECLSFPPDALWRNRSAAAYGAVARADGPAARWIYQGYALGVGFGHGPAAMSRLRGFTSPVPQGQFILLDMGAHGEGQWRGPAWHGQWKVPFIWTALHTYGGDLSIKGNLTEINAIPFAAPPLAPAPAGCDPLTQAVGVGYTPEGLDQNPAYYELLQEAAFKAAPEGNVTAWLVRRGHRRYGLQAAGVGVNADVAAAWTALGASGYAHDEGVSDETGVGLLPGKDLSKFGPDLRTPVAELCLEWASWGSLNDAAPAVRAAAGGKGAPLPPPYTYDLVNTAREVLSQLSTPLSVNFSRAYGVKGSPGYMQPARLNATAGVYIGLLLDLDRLLATSTAFMLGPWLAAARRLGGNDTDCTDAVVGPAVLDGSCADFMEWNARAQLTTWYPTPSPSASYPGQQGGRDGDYARKQWSGLVRDVYAARASLYHEQALQDAAAGQPFNASAISRTYARLSYNWQTSLGARHRYPETPAEDPVAVSVALWAKWAPFFATCG